MLTFVCATRLDEESFPHSPLGRSLERLQASADTTWRIAHANMRGLPEIYNAAIADAGIDDTLVFLHDDVWLDDCFLPARIEEGLARYQLIGVAGNVDAPADHVAWCFREGLTWFEPERLRGAIAHGAAPFGKVSSFGASPADCRLLDGVLLAARAAALQAHGLRFDPRFAFHFYDLDFCRTAHQAGLSLGVWPIALTHASSGNFGTPAWCDALAVYREKWPASVAAP